MDLLYNRIVLHNGIILYNRISLLVLFIFTGVTFGVFDIIYFCFVTGTGYWPVFVVNVS